MNFISRELFRHGSGLLVLVSGVASPALAVLPTLGITTTGDVVATALPFTVLNNEWVSNDEIRLFQEQSSFELFSPLVVDAAAPGSYPPLPMTTPIVPAGTIVDVYLLHFDPDPFGPEPIDPMIGVQASGSVTFDLPVVGLIARTPTFQQATDLDHPLVLYPGVHYQLDSAENAPAAVKDYFSLSSDRRTVTVDFSATIGIDHLRIVVERQAAEVPEPASWVLLLGLVAAAAVWRGR